MQLDWRVSQLADGLTLSEHQIPRVRIILANALARAASMRNGNTQDQDDAASAADRIRALLNPEQRDRLDRLVEEDRILLPS